MSRRTITSDVLFPKPWPQVARSAVLHAIFLASRAVTIVRARAISSRLARLRQATEVERLRNEILLLREELRIKDGRMASVLGRSLLRCGAGGRSGRAALRSGTTGRWCMNVGNCLNSLRFPIKRKKRNVLISLVFPRFMHQRHWDANLGRPSPCFLV